MHVCSLPEEHYRVVCQNARDRVAQLDWANVVQTTILAYREILTIKLFMSEEEGDMLTSLVSFFTIGEVREYLLDAISEARKRSPTHEGLLRRIKVPRWLESWIRVPSSTWIISGVTILFSVIGYLFMRGKGNQQGKNEEVDS